MNKIFIRSMMAAVLLMAAMTAFAVNPDKLGLHSLVVTPGDEKIGVEFSFNPSEWKLPLNKHVKIVPVLRSKSGNDSVVFPSLRIAGKNSYYYALRDNNADRLYRAGKGAAETYFASAPFEKWMEESELDFRLETTGCCGEKNEPDIIEPAAEIDLIPVPFNAVFTCTPPVASGVKERNIDGRAYVSFPVNKTEIYPDYMINRQELRKIMSSIDTVKNDPDATVRSITLTGYASPEGPYANNVRLAKGRTEAVKNYVARQYDFPASVYHTNSVPEDWAGLRDSIAASHLEDKSAMLDFIDYGNVPIEKRNDVFRTRFPRSYAYLLKNVYPWLRHTDYLINYEVKHYTDVEEIKRVIKTNPRNLDINEFYLAAQSYGVGTSEYDEVFITAVAIYPDDEVANLNAGLSAMSRGDYTRAEKHLAKAGEGAEADFARGTLEALRQNWTTASPLFESAKKKGDPRADAALEELDKAANSKIGVTVREKFE